jgi:hypothetical protein
MQKISLRYFTFRVSREGAKMVEALAGNLSLGENSPLHSAASKGELDRVQYLLSSGDYQINSKGMCEW